MTIFTTFDYLIINSACLSGNPKANILLVDLLESKSIHKIQNL